MSTTASLRCPIKARSEQHVPAASGPRQAMVAVIASTTARWPVKSRWKSTHPVIPHTRLVLPGVSRPVLPD